MIPDKIRKLASTLALWGVVGGGFGVIFGVYSCHPMFRAGAAGDPLPGASRKPTADELEAARRTWMIRKFGSETHGPTVRDVIDHYNREHIGPPTPPDAVGAPE